MWTTKKHGNLIACNASDSQQNHNGLNFNIAQWIRRLPGDHNNSKHTSTPKVVKNFCKFSCGKTTGYLRGIHLLKEQCNFNQHNKIRV